MNLENSKRAGLVRDTNIDLAIESPECAKSGMNGVWLVRSTHDSNRGFAHKDLGGG